MKKILTIIEWLMTGVLGFIALITALSALNLNSGPKLYTVLSGSMAPTIPAGSIVLVIKENAYKKNDVITFYADTTRLAENPKQTVTHRIFDITTKDGQELITTKGDFNPSPDGTPIKKETIVGKVIVHLPLIGFAVSFAKTLPGLLILIIIPASIIVYSELLNIKSEIVKLFTRKKEKQPEENTT